MSFFGKVFLYVVASIIDIISMLSPSLKLHLRLSLVSNLFVTQLYTWAHNKILGKNLFRLELQEPL